MKCLLRPALLLVLYWLVAGAQAAPEEIAVKLSSGSEIISQRYSAPGPVLAVWITGQYGRVEEEHQAAADLAARGVETWVTDLLAPYFLPLLPSSMNQIPDRDLGEWLESLHARNPGRRIVLIAGGRASSLAFRGVEAWRRQNPQAAVDFVRGALLMFPLLYQELQPGQEPDYDPIAARTRLDLVILQPKSSAGFWWRERLKSFLESAGSQVRLQVLPGLRDGFYRRSDITATEIAATARLGQILLDGLQPLIENP
jgi:hypothetical protein